MHQGALPSHSLENQDGMYGQEISIDQTTHLPVGSGSG
jgi:hypothetical protein